MRSEIFAEKVRSDPDNMLFRFSLGQALFDEGSTADAVPHLGACCEARDDWMLPRILLGKCLIAGGDREAARPVLEAALRLAVEQEHEGPEAELRGILEGL